MRRSIVAIIQAVVAKLYKLCEQYQLQYLSRSLWSEENKFRAARKNRRQNSIDLVEKVEGANQELIQMNFFDFIWGLGDELRKPKGGNWLRYIKFL